MILHIIQREFFDHLNSLRFALTTLILSVLMVTNAFVHLQTYPERVRKYSENVTNSHNELKSRTQLYRLLQDGPGKLYKRPSSLAFIADGGEAFMPGHAAEKWGNWVRTLPGIKLESIWWLEYPAVNPNAKNIRPKATTIDWTFIIIYLLSFIPLLFTFDALSGERERGTLRLCLANSISRPTLLVGKFLGTFITVLLPFYSAVLLNLAVISTDNWTQLATADWGRLGLIMLIASCYVGIFIAIGLMISAGTRDTRVSLVVLLLIWVSGVVFMPSTLGTLATKWMSPIQTVHQLQTTKEAAKEQLDTDFYSRFFAIKEKQLKQGGEDMMNKMSDEGLHLAAERVNKEVNLLEQFNREHLGAQIAQVQRARYITRFSPAAIVQYALESMAGTGLNRHLQFLEGVHLHIRQFRNFVTETDSADTESLHILGVPEGMSKKPISPQALPSFADKITFRDTFNAAIVDMLLLVLLFGVFLLGAFLVFIRSDV